MNKCICCHGRVVRHLSHRRAYWFCPSCYQEMPIIDQLKELGEWRKTINN